VSSSFIIQSEWRRYRSAAGLWVDDWLSGTCKECGKRFDVLPYGKRFWCSSKCRDAARRRANNHDARARKHELKSAKKRPSYETVGRFELLQAYRGLCALCTKPLAIEDVWVGHIVAVSEGGQHTRDNIAAVHRPCELDHNLSDKNGSS
jgi:5-methylcytosine-specific restriction endonuclease McrA